MANYLTILPTGFSIPDSEYLETVDFESQGSILTILNLHSADFLKNLSSFHTKHNVKRFPDFEREIILSNKDTGKAPFQRYLKLISSFVNSMSGVTVYDWFVAQMNSPFLSKMDKEFLLKFLDVKRNSSYGALSASGNMDMDIAVMSVYLTIPGNRIKSEKHAIDTTFNDKCLAHLKRANISGGTLWRDFVTEILRTDGNKGFQLFLIFIKAVFLSGYGDKEYKGG